jgi:hypothetical protein
VEKTCKKTQNIPEDEIIINDAVMETNENKPGRMALDDFNG